MRFQEMEEVALHMLELEETGSDKCKVVMVRHKVLAVVEGRTPGMVGAVVEGKAPGMVGAVMVKVVGVGVKYRHMEVAVLVTEVGVRYRYMEVVVKVMAVASNG
ncbi:hypothetical protein SAY86_002975 [Trapa natans]|uniref:Uncharacterized protein n=1 Tax=Trapa natans TaxID=22666 RepID=A0AAN7R3W9_TRANT|nr:hypothetical protein SAY86_002975 [Trapa natans]